MVNELKIIMQRIEWYRRMAYDGLLYGDVDGRRRDEFYAAVVAITNELEAYVNRYAPAFHVAGLRDYVRRIQPRVPNAEVSFEFDEIRRRLDEYKRLSERGHVANLIAAVVTLALFPLGVMGEWMYRNLTGSAYDPEMDHVLRGLEGGEHD